MNSIMLTEDQLAGLIESARAEIVKAILSDHAAELQLVSKAQAAGLLDVDSKTLESMGIPRVVLVPKKKIAYRLTDIAAFIKRNIEH